MMNHLPYDDAIKTDALERLAAAGYPSRRGALLAVSRATGVPSGSLRRWVIATSGDVSSIAPPAGVGPLPLNPERNEAGNAGRTLTPGPSPASGRGEREVNNADPSPASGRGEQDAHQVSEDLPDAIRAELLATLRSLAAARGEASYKELAAGFGLLIDKLHLLETSGEAPDETSQSTVRERLAQLFGAGDPQAEG